MNMEREKADKGHKNIRKVSFDCVVVGGGISGMETALNLANMGFKTLIVEKEASIGGKMILLSKVFPTLDCSSCISTPKMAETFNHERITVFTYSEVKSIENAQSSDSSPSEKPSFVVRVKRRPTYVDPSKCTGCSNCEKVCTVPRPDQFNEGLIARRAIYIPFPQAVPKKAVIEKKGLSPCSRSCPAGIRAHGLVALTRNGRFERGVLRAMQDAPFLGALSGLCPRFCEGACTMGKRGNKPVPIRDITAFLLTFAPTGSNDTASPATRLSLKDIKGAEGEDSPVYIVGSGVIALSLSYYLARAGKDAILLRDKGNDGAEGELGGFLWDAVRDGRISRDILLKDIELIKESGVAILKDDEIEEGLLEDMHREKEGLKGVFFEGSYRDLYKIVEEKGRYELLPYFVSIARSMSEDILRGKRPDGLSGYEQILRDGIERTERLNKDRGNGSDALPIYMDMERAVNEAGRCLDCAVCSECYECVRACPASAIDFSMREEEVIVDAKAVVAATGFKLFDAASKPLLGYNRLPNVITAMEMDRLLSPTRPFNAVLRPSDGKVPANIAFILCAGSRDKTAENPWCSRICCMYSIKQAQLLMGAIPIANITIYYIDIRAFGKGYEAFYQQARAMGTSFIKGKVSRIEQADNGHDLFVYYEDMERKGKIRHARHDLVVLSTGAVSNHSLAKAIKGADAATDEAGFFDEVSSTIEPSISNIKGLFVVGAATGPKDIPDCVIHAGACAAQVASYLLRGEG